MSTTKMIPCQRPVRAMEGKLPSYLQVLGTGIRQGRPVEHVGKLAAVLIVCYVRVPGDQIVPKRRL